MGSVGSSSSCHTSDIYSTSRLHWGVGVATSHLERGESDVKAANFSSSENITMQVDFKRPIHLPANIRAQALDRSTPGVSWRLMNDSKVCISASLEETRGATVDQTIVC